MPTGYASNQRPLEVEPTQRIPDRIPPEETRPQRAAP